VGKTHNPKCANDRHKNSHMGMAGVSGAWNFAASSTQPVQGSGYRRCPVLVFCLVLLLLVFPCHGWKRPPLKEMTSYADIQWHDLIAQGGDGGCGQAALATLLRNYYGLSEPLTFTGSRTSLAQLARWAKELGFEPKGLMMDEDGLCRYLERGLPPLLLHLARPVGHFCLALGLVEDHVVLADPAWGLGAMPLAVLRQWWTPITLIIIDPAEGGSWQQESAAIVENRLALLKRLGLVKKGGSYTWVD
jgi:predicted double-glycine peptidase